MGKLDPKKHEEMRKWAAANGYGDPEKLIIRQGEVILYNGRSAIVKYKRLESMFDSRAEDDDLKNRSKAAGI